MAGEMIPGLDVHAAYGRISYKLVASADYRFVYCKSAQGNDPHLDDLSWVRNTSEAQANGLHAGCYFFPYPLPYGKGKPKGRHPLEQAERFHRFVSGFGAKYGELAPMIDAEWPPRLDKTKFVDLNGNGKWDPGEPLIDQWKKWGTDAHQINDWYREHTNAVALLFGRKPVIYTYPAFWKELQVADTSWASQYPLFLADYQWQGPGAPPPGWAPPHLSWVRKTWDDWAICQHSAEGSRVRVPGVPACPVDRDVIKGMRTLRMLLGDPEEAECDDRGAA